MVSLKLSVRSLLSLLSTIFPLIYTLFLQRNPDIKYLQPKYPQEVLVSASIEPDFSVNALIQITY